MALKFFDCVLHGFDDTDKHKHTHTHIDGQAQKVKTIMVSLSQVVKEEEDWDRIAQLSAHKAADGWGAKLYSESRA